MINSGTKNSKKTELYLILGYGCNLTCKNCLNDSGPTRFTDAITEEQLLDAAETIEGDESIAWVHFSGGEPTLYLDKIQRIQKMVKRRVNYAITTNGWFVSKQINPLTSVRLDAVVLSIDEQHDNASIDLKVFSNYCSENKIDLVLHSVIDSEFKIDVLKLPKDLKKSFSRQIHSGRAVAPADLERTNRQLTCPSLSGEATYSTLPKSILHPVKGYSICCGPLAFDNLVPEENLFSKSHDGAFKTKIANTFNTGTNLADIARANGFAPDLQLSACEYCRLTLGCSPAIGNITSALTNERHYFPATTFFPRYYGDFTLPKYRMSYVFLGKLITKNSIQKESQLTHRRRKIIETDFDFLKSNFYDIFESQYTIEEVDSSFEAHKYYMSLDSYALETLKDGEPVGLLLWNKFKEHPHLGFSSIHVGYWGYESKKVTAEEAQEIKATWVNTLSLEAESEIIDLSIDYFNEKSINFARKIGLKQKYIRFDRR